MRTAKLVQVLGLGLMLILTTSLTQAQGLIPLKPVPTATQAVSPAATVQAPVSTLEATAELTPQATEAAGAITQLKLRQPLLGMQLIDLENTPNFYEGFTLGGGDLNVALGGSCVAGYTNGIASLGLVWTGASGPVEIGFNATDPAAPTAVILWDHLRQQWWCTEGFSQGNYVAFNNLDQGMYFVWVLTQTSQAVQGSMFVRATPAK